MIKIKTAVVGFALVGFVGFGVAAVTVRGQQAQAKPPANAVATEPRSGPLKDPQGKALIYALQREPTSLIFFKPSGSIVKKGELVSELDSAALRDALTDQWTVVAVAESTYRNRVKASEIAELSLKEYRGHLEGRVRRSRSRNTPSRERAGGGGKRGGVGQKE